MSNRAPLNVKPEKKRKQKKKVRGLEWTADDSGLVSAGMDGGVYEYSIIQEGHRVSDLVHKGTQFTSVTVYTDPMSGENTMYVVLLELGFTTN